VFPISGYNYYGEELIMQEEVVSSTKLLCPNGHGLQRARKDDAGYLLGCTCTRGVALPRRSSQQKENTLLTLAAELPKRTEPMRTMCEVHHLAIQHLESTDYSVAMKAVMKKSGYSKEDEEIQ
jgi:hypothetical protein